MAIAGGLSILLGYRTKIALAHCAPPRQLRCMFWTVTDPMMAQMQMILFMKNVSMLGGALPISQFVQTVQPDARRSR